MKRRGRSYYVSVLLHLVSLDPTPAASRHIWVPGSGPLISKEPSEVIRQGFYYMANAAGRLMGTVLSGASYQLGGLEACLATAAVMVGISALLAGRLTPQAATAHG